MIWKQAMVIIRKGEDRDFDKQTYYYRPICLLSVLRELQGKLLCRRLKRQRQIVDEHTSRYSFKTTRRDVVNSTISCRQPYLANLGTYGGITLYKNFRIDCQDRYAGVTYYNLRIIKRLVKSWPQGSVCSPIFWDKTILSWSKNYLLN